MGEGDIGVVGVIVLSKLGVGVVEQELVLEAWASVSLVAAESGLLLGTTRAVSSETDEGTDISIMSSLVAELASSEELLDSDLIISKWCWTGEGGGDLAGGEEENGGGSLAGEAGGNLFGSSGGMSTLRGVLGSLESERGALNGSAS